MVSRHLPPQVLLETSSPAAHWSGSALGAHSSAADLGKTWTKDLSVGLSRLGFQGQKSMIRAQFSESFLFSFSISFLNVLLV